MTSTEQELAAATKPEQGAEWSTRLQWAVIIIAVLNLALAVRRLVPIFFPWNPDLMPVVTTGCEEEALFSIWKFTRGETVYSDPAMIPYTISYFNWLFYWLYGGVAKLCLSAFDLSDSWLPVVVRGLTPGIIAGCAGVTGAIIRETGLW